MDGSRGGKTQEWKREKEADHPNRGRGGFVTDLGGLLDAAADKKISVSVILNIRPTHRKPLICVGRVA